MNLSKLLLLVAFSLPAGLQAQTMTVSEPDRVGIRNPVPEFTLHVKHDNGTPVGGNNNGLAISHDAGPTWTLYSSNAGNELRFYRDGIQEVSFSADGSINTLSDGSKKKNISLLPDGQLEKLLAISPKTYQYIDSPTGKECTGFIAQELYTVIPSVVQYTPSDDDGKESWMVSYTSLVPYLVKGIQEQQAIIEDQQKEIELLKQQQQEILNRIAKLENK